MKSIAVFGATILDGNALLRRYPRTMDIHIGDFEAADSGRLLRRALELVPNLTDLTIVAPGSMLSSVFEFEDFPYPFMIKSFRLRTRHRIRVGNFLNCQRQVEVLELAYDVNGTRFRPFPQGLDLALGQRIAPESLPRLREIIIPRELLPLLAHNRPVASIDISSSPLDMRSLASLGEAVLQTTTPLIRLKVGLVVPAGSDPDKFLTDFLLATIHSRESLKELAIVLYQYNSQLTFSPLSTVGHYFTVDAELCSRRIWSI
ncbi:hypothetical protein FRC09_005470 [Ceratobasidium sp. 395]|nr:hypothetical protein FRC09_005470 [Ceratobasidium sp. 395]